MSQQQQPTRDSYLDWILAANCVYEDNIEDLFLPLRAICHRKVALGEDTENDCNKNPNEGTSSKHSDEDKRKDDWNQHPLGVSVHWRTTGLVHEIKELGLDPYESCMHQLETLEDNDDSATTVPPFSPSCMAWQLAAFGRLAS